MPVILWSSKVGQLGPQPTIAPFERHSVCSVFAMRAVCLLLAFPWMLFAQQSPTHQAAGLARFQPRSVPYRTYYPDGQLHTEGFRYETFDSLGRPIQGFVNRLGEYREYLLDSLNVEYWPNGQRRMSALFNKGVQEGPYREWHENGQLAVSCAYREDEKHGLWQAYYSTGVPSLRVNMEAGFRHGFEQQWHPNARLKSEVLYQKGLRQGEARYYCANGIMQVSALYDKDRETGSQYQYYCDGRSKSVVTFSGSEMYLEQFWDPTGEQLVLDGYGRLIGFDSLKRERYEIHYDMGQKNGPARFWYPNGGLKREGYYQNDLEMGEWLFYAEDGLVFDRGSFLRGIRTDLRLTQPRD